MRRWPYLGTGVLIGLTLTVLFSSPATPQQSDKTDSDALPTALVGAGETTGVQEESIQGEEVFEIPVTRVIDGDTIETTIGKVRFLGIQTPERGECGFDSAFSFLYELISRKTVSLVPEVSGPKKDGYGRHLFFVELNGEDIGKTLITVGEAHANRKYPSSRHGSYLEAEEGARSSGVGSLWGYCNTLSSPASSASPSPGCTIKGNISSSDERIYHLPGCGSYEKTVIDEGAGERWFCSEKEALTAGWRKAGNCP